jgi:hypothetical protein
MIKTKGHKATLWRVSIDQELSLKQITESLEAAHADLVSKGKLMEGGLLERVDSASGTTTIYLSGQRDVSRTLGEMLQKGERRSQVSYAPATLKLATAPR